VRNIVSVKVALQSGEDEGVWHRKWADCTIGGVGSADESGHNLACGVDGSKVQQWLLMGAFRVGGRSGYHEEEKLISSVLAVDEDEVVTSEVTGVNEGNDVGKGHVQQHA